MSHTPETSARPVTAIVINSTALAVMLAALSMLGPFSIDAYLPAFRQRLVPLRWKSSKR
jgi:DHA1 family bicyclomycin/chloramphenicol resistance-like MFS transporter